MTQKTLQVDDKVDACIGFPVSLEDRADNDVNESSSPEPAMLRTNGRSLKIRVRFIGALGNFNSVSTVGIRIQRGINAIPQSKVTADLVLLPMDFFASRLPFLQFRTKSWHSLVADTDVVVIVKSALFSGFERAAPAFKALCERNGVMLVSSPADGPGSIGGSEIDHFSASIADYVFTISPYQHEMFLGLRDSATVFYAGMANRSLVEAKIPIRDQVKTVIWENPPHHDPNFDATRFGMPRADYIEFESAIERFCQARGATLQTFGVWRDEMTDDEWQQLLLGADIAIECKSLHGRYAKFQLQKPSLKIQNYLAFGLPVVCDPSPAHLELGKTARLFYADNIEDWEKCLSQLFESAELRAEISSQGKQATLPFSVSVISAWYVSRFEQMLARNQIVFSRP